MGPPGNGHLGPLQGHRNLGCEGREPVKCLRQGLITLSKDQHYYVSIDQDLKILFHVISHVTLQNLLANNENFCSDSFLLCIADLILTSEGIVNIKT